MIKSMVMFHGSNHVDDVNEEEEKHDLITQKKKKRKQVHFFKFVR
jgi:hypothetical protein